MIKGEVQADAIIPQEMPYYLYFEETLERNINKLLKTFEEDGFQCLYAIKANSNPFLVKAIVSKGVGIDASSIQEVEMAIRCGAEPSLIYLNPDCIEEQDFEYINENKVNLTIGSIDAAKMVAVFYKGKKVSVRINTGVGGGHSQKVVTNGESSKFGVASSEIRAIGNILTDAGVKISGLHSHLGSGEMSADMYIDNACELVKAGAGIEGVEFFNFGGGFGFDYKHETVFDIDKIKDALIQVRRDFDISESVTFFVEPGRWLVADTGVLLSKVCSLKKVYDKEYLTLNTGYNHFARCFYYNSWHFIENITSNSKIYCDYDVVGYLCQSGDVFARGRRLPKTSKGDIMCIHDTGAYGYSMSSNFNLKPRPAEYIVRSSGEVEMIRRAEGFDDIMTGAVEGDVC